MRAILDLAPLCDAFICMRHQEVEIWQTIKRTYCTGKGCDLEVFRPLDGVERLEGEPAVLIYENPRGSRNPLYPLIAMKLVWKALPKARFHIFNMNDKKMYEMFHTMVKQCKLWPFVRTIAGAVPFQDVPTLLNRCDIVVSGLFPLFARSLEALACGKALVSYGYDGGGGSYPWIPATITPEAMADTIIACWEDYQKCDYRAHALTYHDEEKIAARRCDIYSRYL
jgi:hypothetical protein